jgi:hypothetical protein
MLLFTVTMLDISLYNVEEGAGVQVSEHSKVWKSSMEVFSWGNEIEVLTVLG